MPRFQIPNGVKIFAFIWLLILILPPTREVFRSYFAYQAFSDSALIVSAPTSEQIAQRLYKQFPDSIPMGMWLGDQEYWRGQRPNAIKRLDALRKKFPQNLEIPALELQLLSDSPRSWDKVKFDTGLMKKAAKIASEAGRSEPQNVFWPLMECGFYFRANQKNVALRALQRAKIGIKYDDYSQQIIRERIRFCEKHESIVWEQKVALWASTLYPYLGHFRETAKGVSKEAMVAKKGGNNKRAIEIITPLLNAAQLMRRDGQIVVISLNGESAGREALRELFGIRAWRGSASAEERTDFQKMLFRKWESFSRENGNSESIKYADFLNQQLISTQMRPLWGDDVYSWLGLPSTYGFITLTGAPLLFWVAIFSLGCSFIWLLHALSFAHVDQGEESHPSRGAITSCVSFSFWVLAGLVAFAIKIRWLNFTSALTGYESSYVFPLLMPVFMVTIWIFPVYFQLQKRKFRLVRMEKFSPEPLELTRLSPENNRLRKFAWIIGLSMIALLYWSFDILDSLVVPALSTAIALVGLVVAIRLEIANQKSKHRVLRRFRLQRVDFPKPSVGLKFRLARLGVWTGFVLSIVMLAAQPIWSSTQPDFILIASFGIVCLGGGLWFETHIGNASFAFARRLAAQSAGVLGIVWSLFFLVGSFGLWPLRAQLNAQWERRLDMSEFDWLKEIDEKNRQNSQENSGG